MVRQLFGQDGLNPSQLEYFLDGCRMHTVSSLHHARTRRDGYVQAIEDFMQVVHRPYDKTNMFYLALLGLQRVLTDDRGDDTFQGFIDAQQDIAYLVRRVGYRLDIPYLHITGSEITDHYHRESLKEDRVGSYIEGIEAGIESATGYLKKMADISEFPFALDMIARGLKANEIAWIKTQSEEMQTGRGAYLQGFNLALRRTLELLTDREVVTS